MYYQKNPGWTMGGFQREFALKVVRPEMAESRRFVELFLRELCRAHGPLPWPAAAYIGSEVARGLEAAHSLRQPEAPDGLVHGDLSPSNVMACFDGAVKVLDFGSTSASRARPARRGSARAIVVLRVRDVSIADSVPLRRFDVLTPERRLRHAVSTPQDGCLPRGRRLAP